MYLWLKLLHVAAVVVFLGNIVTGLFWHAHAARTRDPRLIEHAMDGIIRSDRIFTIPGVILIVISGFAAAVIGGLPIVRTPWILWSLLLFTVSGLAFVARLVPLQRKLRDIARAGVNGASFDWPSYRATATRWELWGALALVTPIIALALMILKPTF